jgi:hypothetical protein
VATLTAGAPVVLVVHGAAEAAGAARSPGGAVVVCPGAVAGASLAWAEVSLVPPTMPDASWTVARVALCRVP